MLHWTWLHHKTIHIFWASGNWNNTTFLSYIQHYSSMYVAQLSSLTFNSIPLCTWHNTPLLHSTLHSNTTPLSYILLYSSLHMNTTFLSYIQIYSYLYTALLSYIQLYSSLHCSNLSHTLHCSTLLPSNLLEVSSPLFYSTPTYTISTLLLYNTLPYIYSVLKHTQYTNPWWSNHPSQCWRRLTPTRPQITSLNCRNIKHK